MVNGARTENRTLVSALRGRRTAIMLYGLDGMSVTVYTFSGAHEPSWPKVPDF